MKHQRWAIGLAAISMLGTYATPLSAATVERTVKLTTVKAHTNWLDTFDTGVIGNELPDFYVVPSIDGRQLSKSQTISEKTSPTFNHTVSTKVDSTKTRVPLAVKLMDNDNFLDSDDTADINPVVSKDILTLNYEPSTGSIYGPDGRKLGIRGQQISIKGDEDKQGVEITFVVSHEDTVAQPPQLPSDPTCPITLPDCQAK